MKKIIVTGKNGELSRAISDSINKQGIGVAENISLRGIEWKNQNFESIDTIVHVAGIVPKSGIKNDDFYNINTYLTAELSSKAKSEGVKHFIYISSMAVYGIMPSLVPQKGTIFSDTPCHPNSDYGKSKLMAEESLKKLEDDNFRVTIIRVPSIFSESKREYFSQYKFIIQKFHCIPIAFLNCLRSSISLESLCNLINLIIQRNQYGVICPDEGRFSSSDYCAMIAPTKNKSRIIGWIIERFLHKHPMIIGLFGTIVYDESLTNIFNSDYREKAK